MTETDPRTAGEAPLPGGSFRLLIQKMGYQALISMGVVENPLTRERSINLPGARAVFADLEMLQDKTRGNLDPDEEDHIEKVLGELREAFSRLQEAAED
ncbi:MAG: DUF1844 domain-containing protein [Planctomycetota bacterium]